MRPYCGLSLSLIVLLLICAIGHVLTCPPSSLSAILPKVEEAFKLFHYIPYTLLSTSAWVKASQGEEEVVLNLSGGFSVRLLNCCNERSISVVDWHVASQAAEE